MRNVGNKSNNIMRGFIAYGGVSFLSADYFS